MITTHMPDLTIASMHTLEEVNRRYESSMRARAYVAKAIGTALSSVDWASHVERTCGRTWAAELQKAAVPAANTLVPGWAGVASAMRLFSGAFLELVKPFTVFDRLAGALRAPMNVNLAADTTDYDPVFTWVGEGLPIPVARFSFDVAPIPPGRVGGIVPFARELAELTDAQNIIERRMVAAVARGTDDAFLIPQAAVSGLNPASVTYNATVIPSSGSTATAIESDIIDAFRAVSNGSPARPYVAMSPSVALTLIGLRTSGGERVFPNLTIMGGDVFGAPVLISPSAQNLLIVIDASGVVLADAGIEITSTEQAAIQQDDSPSAGAANLVSLWQANAVGLKAVRWISWTRRDDAVAYVDLGFGSPVGSPA